MQIAFISCVSKKQNGKHKAKDLYISDLFKKSFKYTSKNYSKVYILSAKYGLISPDDFIKNYDLTLNNFTEKQKQEWSKKVMLQLKNKIQLTDELFFYCGENYRKYLIKWLPNNKHIPLKGLGIGKQLKWYKERL